MCTIFYLASWAFFSSPSHSSSLSRQIVTILLSTQNYIFEFSEEPTDLNTILPIRICTNKWDFHFSISQPQLCLILQFTLH